MLSFSQSAGETPVVSMWSHHHQISTRLNFAGRTASKAWRQEKLAAPSSQQHQRSLQRVCRALAAAADAAHEAGILASVGEAAHGTSFDVATAIALAGCAFESYNEPTRVSLKFQERSNNGTVTTYVDREFLASTIAGVLEIHVQGAKDLQARDLWGTSDPYCILSLGENEARTKHRERTLHPTWHESLQLYVRHGPYLLRHLEEDRLVIRVLDKDTLSQDEDLGKTAVSIQQYMDGNEHSLDLQLDDSQAPASIQLKLCYLPLSEAVGDTEEAEMGGPATGPAVEGLTSGAWKEIAEITGRTADKLYSPLCFIENDVTDTQVWLLWNAAVRSLVIAFRGTEQVKWKDMVTDLSFQPAPFNPKRVLERSCSASLIREEARDEIPGCSILQDDSGGDWHQLAQRVFQNFSGLGQALSASEQQDMEKAASAEPWVHMGFLKAYDSVRAKVMATADEVFGNEPHAWRALVTGHSLGGALATLCSYELANRRYHGRKEPRITMYNYGSPRVGNAAFACAYNKSVPNSWRITNKLDVIPRVPRLMGYSHIGNSCSVIPDGTFEVNEKKADVFEEGHGPEDVLPLLAQTAIRAAQEKGEEDTSEIQALIQHEVEFMQTLVTGSALTEHMEDFYLYTLRALATTEASVNSMAAEVQERVAENC